MSRRRHSRTRPVYRVGDGHLPWQLLHTMVDLPGSVSLHGPLAKHYCWRIFFPCPTERAPRLDGPVSVLRGAREKGASRQPSGLSQSHTGGRMELRRNRTLRFSNPPSQTVAPYRFVAARPYLKSKPKNNATFRTSNFLRDQKFPGMATTASRLQLHGVAPSRPPSAYTRG